VPYELPEGWVWCRMVDTFIIGSSKRVFKHDYVKEGVPFFRSKEIGQLGRGDEVTTELFISRERYNEFRENFGVSRSGDVLMACIGGSIGNTWLVDDREFYYKDGNLVQIRSVQDIEGKYLLKYLDSSIFYDSALGKVSGSAYNALTIEKIKKSLFPLPSLEEQQEIVEKVNSLMALCDELEQQIETSQTQIEQLMQSCLKEVFEYESN
jgi:type I restriction enzyme S subunit